MEQKFNWFNDENQDCHVRFEGLNIIIHKESIVQSYLTTDAFDRYYAGSAFGVHQYFQTANFTKALDWFEYFQSSLDTKILTPKNKKMNKFDKAFQEIIAIEGGFG
jgi:hypothetical protein